MRLLIAALFALLLQGCAGHESRVKVALDALDHNDPDGAIHALNEELEVATADQLPIMEGDNALLLLDRATILQSTRRYKMSLRDFGEADKAIEVLDLSHDAADDIGKYLFSDDSGPYRSPPFEKLLINSFNMMNYLARHDLTGARVEARRLAVMQKFLADSEEPGTSLIGMGSYLAGFAFEKSGRYDEARLHYQEALKYRTYPSLAQPMQVLDGKAASVASTSEAELLIVVGYGRVPQKKPKRIPIGLALTLVAGSINPGDAAAATSLAAKGLVTWINFPSLGKARGRYAIPQLWIDNAAHPFEHALDIEAEVRREWEEHEDTVILSAITRMITRVAAGEVVDAAVGAASGDGIIGLLAGLATSATLSAADTPDTRSWSTLPSNVAIARLRLPAGKHTVRINARGLTRDYKVELRPGGWNFVVMTALR
jgi:hypothetical protein